MMAKQTVDYDVLASSAPINAQAARDFATRGDYEGASEDAVCRLKDVRENGVRNLCPQPQFTDLTGLVKGRLTVVGRCGRHKKKNSAQWLVRCTCGRYETRTTRALRPDRSNDRCQDCERLDWTRKTLKDAENRKGSTAT